MNITDFSNYKKHSTKSQLRDLYSSMEKECIHTESSEVRKKSFFDKSRGRFISIFRKKHDVPIEKISSFIHLKKDQYKAFEQGAFPITDRDFFRLCYVLKANNETSIFIEKLEEAFDPKKREGREQLAHVLKNQFGIVFADPNKYRQKPRKKIVFLKDYIKEHSQ